MYLLDRLYTPRAVKISSKGELTFKDPEGVWIAGSQVT